MYAKHRQRTQHLRVAHFQRKRSKTHFSVEGYFARVRECMESNINVTLHTAPFYSRGFFRRLGNVAWSLIHQADINHITGDITYLGIFLRKSRTVLTILDCQVLDRLQGWRRWIVVYLWFKIPVLRSQIVTVISAETKTKLLEFARVDESKIRIVPVSVSALYTPYPKPFETNLPRILQVGTKANKNIPRLLEALAGIPAQLTIIGPIDRALQANIDRLQIDVKNFVGLSDAELAEQYRAADLLAFVSTCEGFGMPIVEAQFVERPVLTSNCSSMPEVAGEGACLVDPFNVQSIRSGLRRIIDDGEYRERLIENGRINRDRFSKEQIAKQFAEIYLSLNGTYQG
ncbi:glycosyltransferase family 4 protein [Rosistilla oblonga]|uniref:D-inositol 3-phosphate glycosyltransferase n=1 Tax=Rosistilla oblonga TaxID=2527990 RepID=A0A518J1W3_9BACT|nr:glycosyltransferase family 1 protein [Rosistilla oblonga]QDV59329.1 D-inositol 3-phosphate glycosyltransferase [Rosistilla oblonga]